MCVSVFEFNEQNERYNHVLQRLLTRALHRGTLATLNNLTRQQGFATCGAVETLRMPSLTLYENQIRRECDLVTTLTRI